MELEHSFTIPVPVEQAWPVLLDIQQVAPCMPGAAVDSVDGDDFTGSVKVKLGPINLTYKGQAKFVEKDEKAHKAVIDARGRDSRGNGTAAAKITASLDAKGDQTQVNVITDLNITGKPAQFGRGVMVDVGNKLIGQFADCLAGKLAADNSPAAASDAAKTAGTPSTSDAGSAASGAAASGAAASSANDNEPASTPPAGSKEQEPADKPQTTEVKPAPVVAKPVAPPAEPEPIDLIELAGGTVAKKAAPIALGVLLSVLLAIFLTKKKK